MKRERPGIHIRAAAPGDSAAIAAVLAAAFAEYRALYTSAAFAATTPRSDEIERRMSEGPVWVALCSGAIVGTVSAVAKGDTLYIRSMAVLPAASGQGIGALLLRHAERYALAHGCQSLLLSTTPFLAHAIRLYERAGFRRSGEGPHDLSGTPLFTMVKTLAQRTYTADEYLALERAGDQKHEYYAGEVFAMAGGSEQHNLICGNVYASFHRQLRQRQCTVYPGDMRVYIPSAGLYTYPDVSVVCGIATFQDASRDTLLNPTVIVEVLSPSTENYDRGKKFQTYRMLASLQHYLIVAQDASHVEHYIRQSDHLWLLEEFDAPDATFTIAAVDCTLALADIYEKVSFTPS